MTASLEKAFVRASRLPSSAQNRLAEQLLEEISGELKWDRTLERSQDILETLAAGALAARRRGKTVKKGFDKL